MSTKFTNKSRKEKVEHAITDAIALTITICIWIAYLHFLNGNS